MLKLMGYEIRKGSFTNKSTGELVEYNNVTLHYQTDEKKSVKGLFCDNADAKMDDLQIIDVKTGKNVTLDDCVNKDVILATDMTAKTDNEGKARLQVGKIYLLG